MGPALTVSQLNLYLKTLIETDVMLHDIWVVGEITSVKSYRMGGQIYLTLTESDAQLSAVIYETFFGNIKCPLDAGIKVRARGKLRFYGKRGTISFQIAYLEPMGVGALSESFAQLKAKLQAEGLFAAERKQAIPNYSTEVAVIAAPNSAGWVDFKTIVHQLAPSVNITLIPAVMQGPNCRPTVVQALRRAASHQCHIVAIVRGGGSAEDLAWFNDEAIVRAIASCPKPVVTAIGHEIDTTLADLAADERRATPTDAAKLIGTPFMMARQTVVSVIEKMQRAIHFHLDDTQRAVFGQLEDMRTQLRYRLTDQENAVTVLLHRIHQANPTQKLLQGYAVCTNRRTGKVVRQIATVSSGDAIETRVSDGIFYATVTDAIPL